MTARLPRRSADEMLAPRRDPVDPDVLAAAASIVADVRNEGWPAVLRHGERLGDLAPGAPAVIDRDRLDAALVEVGPDVAELLQRTADQIRAFAEAQRRTLSDMSIAVDGGTMGQSVAPVAKAGCYAPGGRFPLPSSLLMTAVTARAAGVEEVWVASPRPASVTLAAAAVAGCDGFVAVGGAQAIAALAYGAGPVPAVDAIAGPGNRWVTAAKQLLFGTVAIDMLAGPSEVLILADETADPHTIAADLLAQCEHDPDASGILVTPSAAFLDAVDEALAAQLVDLTTAPIARAALKNSAGVLVTNIDEGIRVADALAPEHLEVVTQDAAAVADRLRHYGALFVGPGAAEVLGDYGIGPNHTLPTGGSARSFGGLSVHTFLRVRTWMRFDAAAREQAYQDAARFARLEGLEAHARSAERRIDRTVRSDRADETVDGAAEAEGIGRMG